MRMSVKDGRIVLPDGMSYRVLVLPDSQTMTPRLLKKIIELVEAGATVIGPRPVKSPSLENYPACDEEVKKLAEKLWGDPDGRTIDEDVLDFGARRMVWRRRPEKVLVKSRVKSGITPAQYLADAKVPVDFRAEGGLAGKVRWIHRTLDDATEVYFVANKRQSGAAGTCAFRVSGKQPEFFWPQTGRIDRAAAWEEKDGVTRLPLHFEPAESLFVVFRPEAKQFDPIVAMTLDGQRLPVAAPTPKIAITLAAYGLLRDKSRTRNVKAKLQALVDGGQTTFQVAEMARDDDPAYNIVKTLRAEYSVDRKQYSISGRDPETLDLIAQVVESGPRPAMLTRSADGSPQLESWQNGQYELTAASGHKLNCTVAGVPTNDTVPGSWRLTFPADSKLPPHATDKLIAWNKLDDTAKYFSGTATYAKTLTIPAEIPRQGPRALSRSGPRGSHGPREAQRP